MEPHAKMTQTRWKAVGPFLPKLNTGPPTSQQPPFWTCVQRNRKQSLEQTLVSHGHGSIFTIAKGRNDPRVPR